MKFIDILRTANRNMLQSKLRTGLTIVAVFVGALTLTLTNGIGSGVQAYVDQQLAGLGATDVLIIQATQKTTSPIDLGDTPAKYDATQTTGSSNFRGGETIILLTAEDLEKIKNTKGIKDTRQLQSVSPSYISGENGDKYELSVTSFPISDNLKMNAGDLPDNSSEEPQIALPYNYPTTLGFSSDQDATGKQVIIGMASATGEMFEVNATISGVSQKSILNASGATTNNVLLQKLVQIQNQGLPQVAQEKYSAAIAHFDKNLTETQITELKNRLKDAGYTAVTLQDQIGIVKQVINGIITVFNVFGIIALIAASFGVINTLLMAVQERTKEIGLMKAMGMRANQIFLLFSAEAVLLGFWGSFLGVITAMGIGSIVDRIASRGFLKDFVGLNLLTFPWQSVVGIMGTIMLITFLAGTLPARRASRLNPIEALRYE